jgi:hypothetical protein
MGFFFGKVARAANTRIFARPTLDARQYLVYQMEYEAATDVVLVLPLPTPPATATEAVRFVDLSGYPAIFQDLANGFPIARAAGSSNPSRMGTFEALFLASRAALGELDSNYQIPDSVWDRLPEYHDYGFAVFKLMGDDARTVPPIALEFPVRNPNLLYFPTAQIGQGSVEQDTYFDYDLFCQARVGWMRSYDFAQSFMDVGAAEGVVDPNQRVERFTVLGMHPNSDIVLALAG